MDIMLEILAICLIILPAFIVFIPLSQGASHHVPLLENHEDGHVGK
jgi:hypothetical protein